MRTTILNFFCDNANGEYGVAHENAIHNNTPFYAFWDTMGIFHDVWEHYFEDNHQYFKNDYGFNVGGEVAAMGHFYYYTNDLDLSRRAYRNSTYGSYYIADTRKIINATNSDMKEAVLDGYTNYGCELTCNIPYQKPVPYLDDLILEHWQSIKVVEVETEYEQERQSAIEYKKSITLSKLQRLYRWGYRQAEKQVHNNYQNLSTLNSFYTVFDKITKLNAEELSHEFKGIEFKIKPGKHVEWNAHFIKNDNTKIHYQHFLETYCA